MDHQREPAAAAKILVADDSESDRQTALSALRAAGYAVVEASDGQQALEVFGRERPDLVMLDVVMPRITGLEACRILKAKTQSRYLPVILLSTRNSVNARVEGLRSGADDYLGKPYDPEELRARVEVLLRTKLAAAATREPDAAVSRSRTSSAGFRQRIQEEFDRAERYNDPLACLRVELDNHAVVRDTLGNARASTLVEGLREVIGRSVRRIDLVYDVDERGYLLVLPNTHFPGALTVAERIARDVRKLPPVAELGLRPSVSIGVSFFPNKDTRSLSDLLELVDAALARGRSEGGGHVCLYQHQGYLYAPED